MTTTTRTEPITVDHLLQQAAATADWVDAAPFRAQLLLLLEASGLTLPQLAAHLGISPATCQNLLVGRPGQQRIRRISVQDASALLRHTPDGVAEAVRRQVSTHDAQRMVLAMLDQGWTLELLAEVGGIGLSTLSRIGDGTLRRCTNRLDLAVRALHRWSEGRAAPTLLHATRRAAPAARLRRAA
ncbi:hypothetical protein ACQBAR_06005 [Propionibacteriaceae bacterium Y1685]